MRANWKKCLIPATQIGSGADVSDRPESGRDEGKAKEKGARRSSQGGCRKLGNEVMESWDTMRGS